jgi:hypothetical protein
MNSNKPTLTPFEKAEASRTEGIQRIAGTIIVSTWIARIRELRNAKIRMTAVERSQWDAAIQLAATKQFERFGYDA